MKPKKRKDDTGLYMRQWNMELRETISRNMVAYEQKVRECKELKKINKDLKMLCNRLEKEHETVYQEWKAVIEEYKKLQNNRDKAIEVIDLITPELWNISNKMTYRLKDIKYILKGGSDE